MCSLGVFLEVRKMNEFKKYLIIGAVSGGLVGFSLRGIVDRYLFPSKTATSQQTTSVQTSEITKMIEDATGNAQYRGILAVVDLNIDVDSNIISNLETDVSLPYIKRINKAKNEKLIDLLKGYIQDTPLWHLSDEKKKNLMNEISDLEKKITLVYN